MNTLHLNAEPISRWLEEAAKTSIGEMGNTRIIQLMVILQESFRCMMFSETLLHDFSFSGTVANDLGVQLTGTRCLTYFQSSDHGVNQLQISRILPKLPDHFEAPEVCPAAAILVPWSSSASDVMGRED